MLESRSEKSAHCYSFSVIHFIAQLEGDCAVCRHKDPSAYEMPFRCALHRIIHLQEAMMSRNLTLILKV